MSKTSTPETPAADLQKARITSLLFDLGGVIMNIDRLRCEAAFRRLGFADIGDFLGDYGQKGAFAQLESGAIGAAEFRRRVRLHIDRAVSDAEIDNAFEQFLLGIPAARLDALKRLRSRYRLYVLSNTNEIMWNGFIRESFARQGGSIGDYFDGWVCSFEAGSLKPERAIFEYTERHLGIDPGTTLFFDDSQANCEAARLCGFHAAHVGEGREFTDIISELGL